ncbi:MAG: hypothetical protein V3V11_11475 [Vicinamibacteria bacterium]
MSEVNWDHNRQAQDNILDSIGRTPVVRLQRVSADVSADIYVKLEYFSPSGSDEALAMARRMAKEEGIFCGISSGSNVAAALKLAQARPALKRIATMINDSGQRYFTTELCGEAKHVEVPERDHPMDPHTVSELDRYQKNWVVID